MPEIKNTFQAGRMNKDLDERLVPQGEYRDALNIDIAVSQGSDVGTAQNSYGNLQKTFQGQVGNYCVGAVQNGSEDKIVFLVAGTTANPDKIDMILEYNTVSEVVNNIVTDYYNVQKTIQNNVAATTVTFNNVLNIRRGMTVEYNSTTYTVQTVNTGSNQVTFDNSMSASSGVNILFKADRVLNFSDKRKITGLNVIENIIFFTDNISEPKRIPIKRLAAGTPDGLTHSKFIVQGVDKGYLLEEHITVIRKYPLNAPTITMDNSETGGTISAVCQTTTGTWTYTNDDGELVNIPNGSNVSTTPQLPSLTFSPAPDWSVGQTVLMKADSDDNNDDTEYEARVEIMSISQSSTSITANLSLLSLSDGIADAALTWNCVLEQKDPFYELVFPRFAYRWKYVDGEYSVMSPFSNVAFLPEQELGFDYEAKNGYNVAMTNNVRKLNLATLDTPPVDVVEVDILYKESNSTNIYTVETLKGADIYTTRVITSEQVHSVIPSNQILRPYDNVPRKAKAQEISGNRLIYGNYVQQYTVAEDPKFEITHTAINGTPKIPQESLKSIRNYQIGVVFLDKYGRQTPVLSNDSATKYINQNDSSKINKLQAKVTTSAPSWATHFKYFIKEPSAEYYNLAMDRFYPAEDGNVWLSFASAERNKVAIDDYLILKKEHDNDNAVAKPGGGTAKYKVLAIENEAPDFLKEQKVLLGSIETQFGFGSGVNLQSGFPQEDYMEIIVSGADIGGSTLEHIATDGITDKYLRITASGSASDYYAVASITRVDSASSTPPDYAQQDDSWTITIKKPFGKDISFVGLPSNKTAGLKLEWYEENLDLYKAEYAGRFFVKINRDSFLEEKVLNATGQDEDSYMVVDEHQIFQLTADNNDRDDYKNAQRFAIDFARLESRKYYNFDNELGKGIKVGSKKLEIRMWEIGPENKFDWEYPDYAEMNSTHLQGGNGYDFHMALRTVGTLLRFKDDPTNEVYEIKTANYNWGYNYDGSPGNNKKWSSNHGVRYSLTLDKPINFQPFIMTNGTGTSSNKDNLLGVTSPSNVNSKQHNGNNSYPVTRYGRSGDWRKSFSELQVVKKIDGGATFTSSNPAIFETEPKERIDLNLYYETPKTHPIAELGLVKEIEYSNVFSFCNGVESNRIRDDFNAVTIDKGPRVSTELQKQYKEENKRNSMIFSGIFNSTSGVNRLNEFIQAEAITKDLNPAYGSIQKLYARDTNMVVFCEDKTLKVLVDKDALFSAGGNAQLTSSNKTLGQTIPFQGDYGISLNPESFAAYGFRVYYADRNRNAILRLSGDGIEEITRYGMADFFKDQFAANSRNFITGTYDEDKQNYNITFEHPTNPDTISFTEKTKGWTSRKSFIPEDGISLNAKYYTFKNGEIWEHNANATRNKFYDSQSFSTIKFLFNENPSMVKNFKTINFEGSIPNKYNKVTVGQENTIVKDGWFTTSIETDLQSGNVNEFIDKEGKYFNYIKGLETTFDNITLEGSLDIQEFSSQGIGNILSISDDGNASQHVLTIKENAD